MSKNILQFTNIELKAFLLKNDSYCSIDLPPYFNFEPLLKALEEEMNSKEFKDFQNTRPSNLEDINYKIITNKNGQYDWRQLELINPIIYVSLVNVLSGSDHWDTIKERLNKLQEDSCIECMSLPIQSNSKLSNKAGQISDWWKNIEQKSIELSLEYDCLHHTDISHCYSSIYTHSIPWAIHGKEEAKDKEFRNNKDKLGNKIDSHLQAMSYGQTNGIPEGSTLCDFIAEIVLHYADYLVSKKLSPLGLQNFKILRYRDDYRIFCNNNQTAQTILKELTCVLATLGLKLNTSKTERSQNIVLGSLKKDKLDWLFCDKNTNTIQNKLILLHKFSATHPNSGTLIKELTKIHQYIEKTDILNKIKKQGNVQVLIAIVVDIAFINPKTYQVSMAIISYLLGLIDDNAKQVILTKIENKFAKIPNIGVIELWLQRVIIKYDGLIINATEQLTKLVEKPDTHIWNIEWANYKISEIIKTIPIVDKKIIDELDTIIDIDEVSLFPYG